MSASNTIKNLFGGVGQTSGLPNTSNAVITTTGTATGPYQQWNPPVQQTGTLGGLGGGYYPTLNTYPINPIPPTLPIKLGMKELIKLAQVMDTDPELHEIIKKFQPWIGVEV